MRVWVLFAFALSLAVSCGGKTNSSLDDEPAAGGGAGENGGSAGVSGAGGVTGGGPATGGSAGSARGGSAGTAAGGDAGTATGGSATGGTSGDANCNDERRAVRDLINENKSCSETADCATHYVGCGITEDGCTGAVYTNASADQELFAYHRIRLEACLATYENTSSCAQCDRVSLPPTCSNGLCVGGAACALETAALWDFKTRNDACKVDDDCVTEAVGCEVTEDDCTGAVYFAHDFDREEFTQLRDEYYACAGMCGACRRAISPPACVSGHCVIRPLR